MTKSGAYSDDHADCAELVIERERASQGTGTTFDAARTLLIGETPRDTAVGLTTDVRVIPVASGRSSAEELKLADANAALPDLTDLAELQRPITGLVRRGAWFGRQGSS